MYSSQNTTTQLKTSSNFQHIPIIDVAALVSTSSTHDEKLKVAKDIHDACSKVGFFYIKNHGIDSNLMDDVFSQMKKFFELPEQHKNELKLNEIFRGYFANEQEVTNGIGDWKEGYDLGLELPSSHPDVIQNKPLHGPNPWPSESLLPGWKDTMMKYTSSVIQLGSDLMRGVALSLEMEQQGIHEEYFKKNYGIEPVIFMRLLKYFPSPEQKLGVGAHTDYGCLTILAQDDVGGLQAQNGSGEWVAVPPIPGTFVVNIGDMLQIWTDDLYPATVHRVITHPTRTRYSVAFCYEPNFDAVVTPLIGNSEGKAKYGPVKYGEHVMKKILKSFPEESHNS